jgi:hypothetical protein
MMPDVDIKLHTTVDVFEEPIKKAAQKYGFKTGRLTTTT